MLKENVMDVMEQEKEITGQHIIHLVKKTSKNLPNSAKTQVDLQSANKKNELQRNKN